ncbi:glycosyltransferase family 1 protein [Planctomycetales bacterium ZRK34]|nr:glycosyltransferase family 1 protein [Planctomycetales bacterium ZRK34]
MRIVITGLAATFPYGGVFWDYLQYALGLHQLGHDVLYLEDTGKWCYNPEASTFVESGEENARRLAANLDRHMPELNGRWAFRDGTCTSYGRDWKQAMAFCRSADLFIHLSASCLMEDDCFEADRVAFVDSDPMYTQAKLAPAADANSPNHESALEHLAWLKRHDVFFTFGENVGNSDCLIPNDLIRWQPTRQPITIDRFTAASKPIDHRRRTLTTVGSWNPHEVSVQIDGQSFGGKSIEFQRFLEAPKRLSAPMELAISGNYPAGRLIENGWNPIDALGVSLDPAVYRDYLADSLGEFSVAKHAYVASRSGWFSCRSACYLALSVPVVVQDTGFSRFIPTGKGLFAFNTADEAAAGVEAIVADPAGQSRAALEIAREYFDASTVLQKFIEAAMGDAPRATGEMTASMERQT